MFSNNQKYSYIKLKDVLSLLGKDFHLYEKGAYVSRSKEFKSSEPIFDDSRMYAQHITNLNIKEITYYKDLWFTMYVHTGKKSYTIYDDNVEFNEEVFHVSRNPYISPLFVMQDKTSYMDAEESKMAELIKLNERFLNWLHYMGITDDQLQPFIIEYEPKALYHYKLPNIKIDSVTGEFQGYMDGKLELKSTEINEIISEIKNPELRGKTEYLLKNLGKNILKDEREVYDYD